MAEADKASTAMTRLRPQSSRNTNTPAGSHPMRSSGSRTLEKAAGKNADAIATLERINYIYPVKDEELHHRLGDLLYAQKDDSGAIREFNALVALNPVDKAGAEFSLAQAYFAAGDKDKAQDSVLAALETAPGYRPGPETFARDSAVARKVELKDAEQH